MIVGEKFRTSGVFFILPVFVFLMATTLLPILYVVVTSFFRNYLPEKELTFILFKNFQTIFKDEDFLKAILQTLKYAFITTACHITLALVLALYFDKNKGILKPLASSMRSILIIPWLLSWTVAASIWQLILNPSGLINGYLKSSG